MSLRVAVTVWPAMLVVQPVPLAAVGVSPAGSVDRKSVVQGKGPEPGVLPVTVKVSAASPWRKVPAWLLAVVSAATGLMVVGSLAVSLAVFSSPPPATVAVLVSLVGALLAQMRVRVRGG